MDKTKFNTSVAVVIALIVVGGFFGLQKLFMKPLVGNQNATPDQTKLGKFADIKTPVPSGDPEKVSEEVFLSALSEFDLALMVDDKDLITDYDNIINSTLESYEQEI